MTMIVEVTEENILRAAQVHSLSGRIRTGRFAARNSSPRIRPKSGRIPQKEIARGKQVYIMIEDGPVGIVRLERPDRKSVCSAGRAAQGIRTRLLLFAASMCEGAPALWVLSNNRSAYRLYSKNGFCETGRRTALSGSLFELEIEKAPLNRFILSEADPGSAEPRNP
jgi:hypothetical protein